MEIPAQANTYQANLLRYIQRAGAVAPSTMHPASKDRAATMFAYGWLELDIGDMYYVTAAGAEKLAEYEASL